MTAAAQVLYAPLVLVRPTRMVLLLGIWGNLTIVVPYLLIRMVGIPLFGPGAGIGRGDRLRRLVRYSFGVGIAAALGAALLRETTPKRRRMILLFAAVGLVSVGHVAHLVLLAS